MKLVNKNGSINQHESFTYQKKSLRVIGTSANEHPNTPTYRHSVWLAIDLIKNIKTGKVTEVSRKKLFELNIDI